VNALRARQKRNLVVSLLLSQGVPMLLAGDEIGHTQNGNNNAYCQDNEISWLNWELGNEEQQLYDFVARIIALRRQHPVFSRRRFLQEHSAADEAKEVMWFTPEGGEMTEQEWNQEFARCLGVYLAGTAIRRIDRRGQAVKDGNFLVLFNAHHEAIDFVLPQLVQEGAWTRVLDTALDADPFAAERYGGAAPYPLQGRSVALLVESVDG
jgi:isoamylase